MSWGCKWHLDATLGTNMISEDSCISFLKIVQTFDSRAYVYDHEDPCDLNLMYWTAVQY